MKSFILFYVKKSLFNKTGKIKLQSIIAFFGIIFSVIILTVSFSLFSGYEKNLKSVILGANSHIYLFRNGSDDLGQDDIDFLSEFLKKKPEIKAFAPAVSGTGIIVKNKRLKNIVLKGIESEKEKLPVKYKEYVTEGSPKLANENDAVVGDKLAEDLNLETGDEFTVVSPAKSKFTFTGLKQEKLDLKIVGLYNSGMEEYDSGYVFINAQKAFEFTGKEEYSLFEISLKDEFIDSADKLAWDWENELPESYQINSWIYFNGNLFSLLSLQKWILTGILSILLIISSFNLISSITTDILEHKEDIGILKTFGLTNAALEKIFLLRLVSGSIIAVLIGQIFGVVFGNFIASQNLFTLDGDVYFIEKISFEYGFIAWVSVFVPALVIVIVAALIPLKRIHKMNITDIIRN
ncbi:MAG: hypothetical protein CSB55_05720 [Candidatus Cloacimonadota bacterium]|nr:MAG: hypothetical protein CSB55_05720 [Candidatus Cloacimonadota bacterium]